MEIPWQTADSGDLLWPPAAVLAGAESLPTDIPPWDRLVSGAAAVFGILPAVSGAGVTLLENWLRRSSALRIRLVIPVYPGGRTRGEDLRRLHALQAAHPGRMRAGILPLAGVADRASLALCFAGAGSHSDYLAVGAYEHFRPGQGSALGPALLCRLGEGVTLQLLSYLGALEPYTRSIETPGTVGIPEISLRKPTEVDQASWRAYRAPCVLASSQPAAASMLADDLGLPVLRAPASFAETIATVYARGKLVVINERTRLPPLDAPVRPEWFGWSAETVAGALKASLRMRASPFTPDDLKVIERARTSVGPLRERFTYGMGTNLRWLPEGAAGLLVSEMERVDAEGRMEIDRLLGVGADRFLRARRDKLWADACDIYERLGGRGEPPADTLDRIVEALRPRLEAALSGRVIPTISLLAVSFAAGETEQVSPWDQAFEFLLDLARLPRKAHTDPYFWRGLRVEPETYLGSMDVTGDAAFEAETGAHECVHELDALRVIEHAEESALRRCERVWALIRGDLSVAVDGLEWQPQLM